MVVPAAAAPTLRRRQRRDCTTSSIHCKRVGEERRSRGGEERWARGERNAEHVFTAHAVVRLVSQNWVLSAPLRFLLALGALQALQPRHRRNRRWGLFLLLLPGMPDPILITPAVLGVGSLHINFYWIYLSNVQAMRSGWAVLLSEKYQYPPFILTDAAKHLLRLPFYQPYQPSAVLDGEHVLVWRRGGPYISPHSNSARVAGPNSVNNSAMLPNPLPGPLYAPSPASNFFLSEIGMYHRW